MLAMAEGFGRAIEEAETSDDLREAISEITTKLGFDYFALTHHVDVERVPHASMRLHNYPENWVDYFDGNRLAVSDPVHRASHVTSVGFTWRELPQLIAMTPSDRMILALAREEGLGEGFTVPAHVPGEARGSCSFACPTGRPLPTHILPLAQLAGAFAFEGARRMWRSRTLGPPPHPVVTDRQRDCLIWVARGKTDWEISRIIGISPQTVVRHIKQARERYGVEKRTSLLIRTLFDGTISFTDIFRR
ncbi:helix-turn-helix transcriptional regulator [Allosphingosinicella sp.]|uniref:helix-turn-helix transcriptional regulator n=1 Tax=Allosphingosinicella sp. TaxID=2823234 RepID=UPI003D763614